MKSVTWKGKTYGIPTNNETMAFIWNADIFKRAGLDPEKPPATWDDVVKYSKQIHESSGMRLRPGRPQERRQHALPLHASALGLWRRRARRSRAAPDLLKDPAEQRRQQAALQASYDMYVRDKSVPVSALTNQQTENQPLFLAGQLGMMIAHPSEYDVMLDPRKRRRAATRRRPTVVANMRYGLIPTGPAASAPSCSAVRTSTS